MRAEKRGADFNTENTEHTEKKEERGEELFIWKMKMCRGLGSFVDMVVLGFDSDSWHLVLTWAFSALRAVCALCFRSY